MKNCVLTAEEVLYIAASFGADAFYGIPDRLSRLSDNALRIKVMELEDSLSSKDYAKRDFDGNITLDEEITATVVHCADCDGFVCAEIEKVGHGQSGVFYFIKDGKAVKMFPNEERYSFEWVDAGQVANAVTQDIEWKVSGTEKKSFVISLKNLQKAQNLAFRGAVNKARELFMEAGAEGDLLETAMEGILHKADYYSYLFLDIHDETDSSIQVSFLQGSSLAAVAYREQDNKDYIEFSLSTKEELVNQMEAGMLQLSINKGTESFA